MEMPTGDKPIPQKPVISPLHFVEMVNARLRTHPLYRDGMEVYAIPRHAQQPRSMVCAGPPGAIGVCNTIVRIVRGEYDVVPDIDEEWHRRTPDLPAPPLRERALAFGPTKTLRQPEPATRPSRAP
ncbi:hypothetical protein [Cupriavidus respiraculi]|uniref:hypothetical protein n=1 Tax=Cupriavidus respiraculi TaxID=195930 RepID=UPI001F20C12A|nr:hypothetical protein [Cupriavidus respiraculi]